MQIFSFINELNFELIQLLLPSFTLGMFLRCWVNTSGSVVVMGITTVREEEGERVQGHLEGNSEQIQHLPSPPAGVGSIQRLSEPGTELVPRAGCDGFGIAPCRALSLVFNQVE